MIVYDLICENNHEFEGWFKDLNSYEAQENKGLICCPACNNNKIKRLLRGRTIKAKDTSNTNNQAQEATQNPSETKPALYYKATIETIKYYQRLKDYVIKNFDDVGENFAEEARKIHYGDSEKKNIRGTTTDEEEKELKNEGIQLLKFPLLKYNG